MRAFKDTGSRLPVRPQDHRLSFCHSRTLAQACRCREVNMKIARHLALKNSKLRYEVCGGITMRCFPI
jgi:hypothetical protein